MSGLFERIADRFESGEMGWCQHASFLSALGDKPDSFCLEGAVAKDLDLEFGVEYLTARVDKYQHVSDILNETVRQVGHRPDPITNSTGSFVSYNDDPTTTKQDVIDVLRKAAANYPHID